MNEEQNSFEPVAEVPQAEFSPVDTPAIDSAPRRSLVSRLGGRTAGLVAAGALVAGGIGGFAVGHQSSPDFRHGDNLMMNGQGFGPGQGQGRGPGGMMGQDGRGPGGMMGQGPGFGDGRGRHGQGMMDSWRQSPHCHINDQDSTPSADGTCADGSTPGFQGPNWQQLPAPSQSGTVN